LELDLRDVLPSIHVPTLVGHSRDFQFIPVEQGRYVAANIPGAEYVEVASADGVLQFADGDFYLGTFEEFLTGVRRGPEADRVLATVLFTDIVGSTQRAASMGDRSWRDLLAQHHRVVRRELATFKGKEVDTAGDGFMARFDGPARAIRCAQAILKRTQELGLDLRAGIHTGECEILDKKLSGIAVHIAARVAALAGAGEVVVSRTVTDLVAGSGLGFSDRGVHTLKGVPGEWRIYSVDG
jgi:class 3 adenylate cyclase